MPPASALRPISYSGGEPRFVRGVGDVQGSDAGRTDGSHWYDQWMEFTLVLVLLLALWFLVNLVLQSPIPQASATKALEGKDVLAFRSGLMTALLGTFGAWIGAGAAYFFGSKNLKRATDAIEKAQLTGQQRLSSVKLRDMDPKPQPIANQVRLDEPLSAIEGVLEDPKQWWIAVVNANGTLNTVLHEESYYRYYMEELKTAASMTKKEFDKRLVSDLTDWVKKRQDWNWVLYSIYVPAAMDMTAAAVNEAMIAKGVHVAIVLDEKKKPTKYVTAGEIKQALEKC